nr:MAG TPA: hypothetical protein [Caudoviricetes sp.]
MWVTVSDSIQYSNKKPSTVRVFYWVNFPASS